MDRYAVVLVDAISGSAKTDSVYEGTTHNGDGDVASEQAHRRAKSLEDRGFKAFVVGLKGYSYEA